MRTTLTAIALTATLTAAACAPAVRPPEPTPAVSDRLAATDAQLQVGCYDCLTEALEAYEAVRSLSDVRPADLETATVGAVRALLLLDLRQRELGMADDGYLRRAREMIAAREDLARRFAADIETIESIPWRISRFNIPTAPEELQRMQELRRNYAALLEQRRALADQDPLAAYGWLAFYCTHASNREDRSLETLLAPLDRMRSAPMIRYRAATCVGIESDPLTDLLEQHPRYVEITHWLGQAAMGRLQLEEADRLFSIALQWRPRWPAVTAALGNVYFAFEEMDRALDLYDQTIALAPGHPDALIGRAKALSLLLRHDEAFAAIDDIFASPDRVFPGEAYYWRAWNNVQIRALDQAWADVEEAGKLWVNSEVSKLAGIIAYRRRQLDVARSRFEAARKLAPTDCETTYYLGNVHAEQAAWALTATTFTTAAGCIERGRQRLRDEIDEIAASTWSLDRKERQIARREAQIADAGRMLATSWFNTAVAHFNLGHRDDARQFAERVVDDEQFSTRARAILERLP